MKNHNYSEEYHIGGKDWDKFIICERCNKKPTQCTCKKDNFYESLSVY